MPAQYKATRPTRYILDQVLKKLKNNKARDPNGLIVQNRCNRGSLFLMCYNLEIPELLKFANITSIYKGKGAKNDLQNERGIFSINIFRSLILKLIHNDEYDNIDENMSDSNVGGRKKKNIGNRIFIINSIINEAVRKNTNIDQEMSDFKQCFDSMWLEETINDLYALVTAAITPSSWTLKVVGVEKCHKIRCGKNRTICPPLYIDSWKTKKKVAIDKVDASVEDVYDGVHLVKSSNEQKYLGDVICSSWKNDKIIADRIRKGSGIIQNIMSILEELYFGRFFAENPY